MARHAAFAGKRRAGNTNANVRAISLGIGARMACMGSAFVQHFQMRGVKLGLEPWLDLVGMRG